MSDDFLAEKDRLDRVSLEQSWTNDPVERLIGDALTSAGYEWQHEQHPDRKAGPYLDFKIKNGPYIEVKRFYTERTDRQLKQAKEIIVIQGIEAARWFAAAISPMVEVN